MALVFIILMVLCFNQNSRNKKYEKIQEEKAIREQKIEKFKRWEDKVTDMSLQRAVEDALWEDKLTDELEKICREIGLDSSTLSEDDEIFLLMANRGYLTVHAAVSGYYEESNYVVQYDPSDFKDNAVKIIPWVIKKLKEHKIYDDVYAHVSGSGYCNLYVRVESDAYNHLIDMGVKFSEFKWEQTMWSTELEKAVERVNQISEKDMAEFKRLAKRLRVTKL